jgi:hypothetical protein
VPTNFDWVADEIRKGRIEWRWLADTGIPGTQAIIATTPHVPFPVGQVWYRHRNHKVLDIMNSFVFEHCRRCGVRTFLHNELINLYGDLTEIYSNDATDSGAAWMTATGFVKRPDGWHFRVRRKKSA